MGSQLLHFTAIGALCASAGFFVTVAEADVTTENTISVEGVGAMAFGNMSGTTRTTISGDKSRTDSDIQMKSRVVRMLAHGSIGPTARIVRLDQDKIYQLDLKRKEFTERTFEQVRGDLDKLGEQAQTAQERQEQQPSAVDESKCDWLPPKVDVRKTGEQAQIAGYAAEHVAIVAAQPCKDKSTGAICEVALVLDEWLTSGFTESAEVQKYHKAYAAKMGLDPTASQGAMDRAKAMFSRYHGVWGELVSKMQGIRGYPVRSSVTLAVGGEQCQNANARQEQSSNGGAGNSASALAGQMAGKLGSLFHKKTDDSASTPAQTAAASPSSVPAGDVALMTIATELISVSTAPAAANAFEVPGDFKKKETTS